MILLAFIVLGGTLAAIAFHAWNALYLHHGYPQSTFLFLPDDRFMDFLNGYRYARDLGHGSLSVSYSPLVMFCLWILTSVPSTSAYLFVAAAFSLLATLMVWRFIADAEPETVHRMMVTLILVAMSYPMLFILDRGNLDIFVFAALAGFFYLHFVRHSAWSIVFLAAAIAFKYYPATLLVLLLADRLYRRTLLTVALAVAMTAASAWALGFTSGLGYAGVLQAVRDQLFAHGEYSQTLGSVQYSHNVWSVLAWVTDLRGMESFPQQALTPWCTCLPSRRPTLWWPCCCSPSSVRT